MEWELGTESETRASTGRSQGHGFQHAVQPGKIDASGNGRPLAVCGADVRVWRGTSWQDRSGLHPICQQCEDDTARLEGTE